MKKGSVSRKARIFLVDDHPIVRRGIQLLIGLEGDMSICGQADDAPVALEQIGKLRPDVAVVDLALKHSSGLDLVKSLRVQCPAVKVLVFTMHDEPLYAERVLKAGAHGYVTKEEGSEKAIEAIRSVLQGKPYISGGLANRMIESLTGFAKSKTSGGLESLSDRELEVLDLIGRGLGSQEIARHFKVSVKTVESHREHLKAKLGLRRATELVQYAFNWVHREKRI